MQYHDDVLQYNESDDERIAKKIIKEKQNKDTKKQIMKELKAFGIVECRNRKSRNNEGILPKKNNKARDEQKDRRKVIRGNGRKNVIKNKKRRQTGNERIHKKVQ